MKKHDYNTVRLLTSRRKLIQIIDAAIAVSLDDPKIATSLELSKLIAKRIAEVSRTQRR